jgi:hypothetical protein
MVAATTKEIIEEKKERGELKLPYRVLGKKFFWANFEQTNFKRANLEQS